MSVSASLGSGVSSTIRQSAASPTLPAATAAAVGDAGTPSSPSTIVTLSAPPSAPKWTYTLPDTYQAAPVALRWKNSNDDPVNAVMASALSGNGTSGRFNALGAAMLNRFKTSGDDFSQAVSIDPAQLGLTSASLSRLPSQIGLTVKTATGITVELTLTQINGTLAVQVTSSETLSEDERVALAKLSDAFQSAIDGLTADKPSISIAGLTEFDPTVLSAVDLTAKTPAANGEFQTFTFHADSRLRTLDLALPSGTISLSTDLSTPALWGNEKQHDKAITSYLERFDAAQRRGHGNANLAGLFKDAFVQLNGGYAAPPADSTSKAKALNGDALNDEELALLSGLADFQASLVQTITKPNPKLSKHDTEVDSFSYQIAQQTMISDVKNTDMRERSITQTQSSALRASYHEPPKPGAPLFPPPIDGRPDPDEQSYYYYQITDKASSEATIVRRWLAERPQKAGDQIRDGYTKDFIVKADLRQTASQSTHMTHFDRDKLVEDITTPANNSRILDLLSLLPPSQNPLPKSPDEERQRQGILEALNTQVSMLDDPAQI